MSNALVQAILIVRAVSKVSVAAAVAFGVESRVEWTRKGLTWNMVQPGRWYVPFCRPAHVFHVLILYLHYLGHRT